MISSKAPMRVKAPLGLMLLNTDNVVTPALTILWACE